MSFIGRCLPRLSSRSASNEDGHNNIPFVRKSWTALQVPSTRLYGERRAPPPNDIALLAATRIVVRRNGSSLGAVALLTLLATAGDDAP